MAKTIKPANMELDKNGSARRWMPVDLEIGEVRESPRDNFADADRDYFGQLRKFKQYAETNGGHAPTREGYGKK